MTFRACAVCTPNYSARRREKVASGLEKERARCSEARSQGTPWESRQSSSWGICRGTPVAVTAALFNIVARQDPSPPPSAEINFFGRSFLGSLTRRRLQSSLRRILRRRQDGWSVRRCNRHEWCDEQSACASSFAHPPPCWTRYCVRPK